MTTRKSERRKNGANLTDEQVWEILEMSQKGETLPNISDKFNISVQMVFQIRHGERYSHVYHPYKDENRKKEWLKQLEEYYKDTSLSLIEIAKKMNVSEGAVHRALRKYGMKKDEIDKERRSIVSSRITKGNYMIKDPDEIESIVKAYESGVSCLALSKRHHVYWETMKSLLIREGVYGKNV